MNHLWLYIYSRTCLRREGKIEKLKLAIGMYFPLKGKPCSFKFCFWFSPLPRSSIKLLWNGRFAVLRIAAPTASASCPSLGIVLSYSHSEARSPQWFWTNSYDIEDDLIVLLSNYIVSSWSQRKAKTSKTWKFLLPSSKHMEVLVTSPRWPEHPLSMKGVMIDLIFFLPINNLFYVGILGPNLVLFLTQLRFNTEIFCATPHARRNGKA